MAYLIKSDRYGKKYGKILLKCTVAKQFVRTYSESGFCPVLGFGTDNVEATKDSVN
jgi:hypothetical protein